MNEAVGDALREAEALLVERLGAVSLAQLGRGFEAQCSGEQGPRGMDFGTLRVAKDEVVRPGQD